MNISYSWHKREERPPNKPKIFKIVIETTYLIFYLHTSYKY